MYPLWYAEQGPVLSFQLPVVVFKLRSFVILQCYTYFVLLFFFTYLYCKYNLHISCTIEYHVLNSNLHSDLSYDYSTSNYEFPINYDSALWITEKSKNTIFRNIVSCNQNLKLHYRLLGAEQKSVLRFELRLFVFKLRISDKLWFCSLNNWKIYKSDFS